MTEVPPPGLLSRIAAAELAERLREIGYTVPGVAAAYGERSLASLTATDAASRAARRQILADDSPLGVCTRMFLLGERIDGALVRRTLPAVAAPLLQGNGSVVARVDLSPYGDETHDWYVVSDRTDDEGRPARVDHVLGIGGAATSLAQLTVRTPVKRALDVGTGCGLQALHLATHAGTVTATDISDRALTFAATTAALSGVDVELLVGDLTAPVADREFDLVVSNPPFVLGPAADYVYRDAPASVAALDDDGFCRRAVRDCASVLAEGGVAQLLVNWLHVKGEDWRDRVASWVGDLGCDAWLIERDLSDPLDYVRTWAADAGQSDDPALAARWLDWLGVRDVEAVGFGWVVLRRAGSPHRVAVEQVVQAVDQPLGMEIAEWLVRTEWLRGCSDDGLLAHAFRRAPQARLIAEALPGSEGWETAARTLVLDKGFHWSLPTDEPVAALVAGCDGSTPLRDIVSVLELLAGAANTETAAAACNAVRALVDRGLLLP